MWLSLSGKYVEHGGDQARGDTKTIRVNENQIISIRPGPSGKVILTIAGMADFMVTGMRSHATLIDAVKDCISKDQ